MRAMPIPINARFNLEPFCQAPLLVGLLYQAKITASINNATLLRIVMNTVLET
jgi:hypothetical protein